MPQTPTPRRNLLGGAVKQIRLAKGITQAQLATAADIHFAHLSKIESGKQQPSLDLMCRLANALHVALDDITYVTTVYVVTEDDPA